VTAYELRDHGSIPSKSRVFLSLHANHFCCLTTFLLCEFCRHIRMVEAIAAWDWLVTQRVGSVMICFYISYKLTALCIDTVVKLFPSYATLQRFLRTLFGLCDHGLLLYKRAILSWWRACILGSVNRKRRRGGTWIEETIKNRNLNI